MHLFQSERLKKMTFIQLIIISWLLLGCCQCKLIYSHGPLARYVKLRFEHAPWMPGTFPPPPWFSDPDINHGKCVTHVPYCMPGNRWRGKRSRHSRRMLNPQCYIPGKRPMSPPLKNIIYLCSIKQMLSLAITGNRLGLFGWMVHKHYYCDATCEWWRLKSPANRLCSATSS